MKVLPFGALGMIGRATIASAPGGFQGRGLESRAIARLAREGARG